MSDLHNGFYCTPHPPPLQRQWEGVPYCWAGLTNIINFLVFSLISAEEQLTYKCQFCCAVFTSRKVCVLVIFIGYRSTRPLNDIKMLLFLCLEQF
jgi:hypothetical protein